MFLFLSVCLDCLSSIVHPVYLDFFKVAIVVVKVTKNLAGLFLGPTKPKLRLMVGKEEEKGENV